MIKYELKKSTNEIYYKDRYRIKSGCTLEDSEPETIETFLDKEVALEALKNYKSMIYQTSSAHVNFFEVTEYFVEENTYGEDDEWMESGGVWEFSKFEIFLRDDNTDEIIATFDSYEAADKAHNNTERDCTICFY